MGFTVLKPGSTLSELGSAVLKPGFEEMLLQGALRLKRSAGLHTFETGLHIIGAGLRIIKTRLRGNVITRDAPFEEVGWASHY